MKNDENQWISISDLMSGLMMIFLFVSILFLTKEQNKNKDIKEIIKNNIQLSKDINKTLDQEFKKDYRKFGMIRLQDGTLRFQSPRIMFSPGSYALRPKFKNILEEFCPRYIGLMYSKFGENISEIKIVGHSSSDWATSSFTKKMKKNVRLSANRAFVVQDYCYQSISSNMKKWFSEKITITGAGYVHKIKGKNGKENKTLSRRVEFQIQTKKISELKEFLRKTK